MKNIMFVFVAIGCMTIFTGCSTIKGLFDAKDTGYVTGRLLYVTYSGVEKDINNEDFSNRVKLLWTQINKIESTEDLYKVKDDLIKKFDDVIANAKLTDSQKVKLTELKDRVSARIQAKLTSDSLSDDSIDFLVGVRSGINDAIIRSTTVIEIKK